MRFALLYQLIAFILAFFHNSSQTFSFFIKYSNCDCILSAFDFTNFQIHSAISKQPELFVVVIQHPHDIHSKILMGPFSDTDGRQKIIDFQRSSMYSLLSLSIRQCRMILFLDFLWISCSLFNRGQSPQMCNSNHLGFFILEKAFASKCNPFKGHNLHVHTIILSFLSGINLSVSIPLGIISTCLLIHLILLYMSLILLLL